MIFIVFFILFFLLIILFFFFFLYKKKKKREYIYINTYKIDKIQTCRTQKHHTRKAVQKHPHCTLKLNQTLHRAVAGGVRHGPATATVAGGVATGHGGSSRVTAVRVFCTISVLCTIS